MIVKRSKLVVENGKVPYSVVVFVTGFLFLITQQRNPSFQICLVLCVASDSEIRNTSSQCIVTKSLVNGTLQGKPNTICRVG
jgi:hypothetical protein